jgi:WD40 repeat protein
LNAAGARPATLSIVEGRATGARLLVGHERRVQSTAISRDGAALATASFDGTVKLWDVSARAGAPILECALPGELPPGVPAVLSEDLKQLSVLGPEHKVNTWDTARRRQVASFAIPNSSRVVISPNRQQFVVADDGGFELGDLAAPHERVALAPGGPLLHATFSPSGRSLATLNQNGDLIVWDVMGRRNRCQTSAVGSETSIVFTSDDSLLLFKPTERVRLKVKNAEQTPFPGDQLGQLSKAIYSPDSLLVAALHAAPTAALIDAQSGETRHLLHLPELAQDAAFSPDGRTLATASSAGRFILWHVPTGQEILNLSTPPGEILAVRFSRDGRSLAAVVRNTARAAVYLWSADVDGIDRLRRASAAPVGPF